jgi:hypothetical protein
MDSAPGAPQAGLMDLLTAVLLARLIDPVTIVVAVTVALLVRRWWGVLLAGVLAAAAAEAALAALQPGRPLLGFALIGGTLAGMAWAAAALIIARMGRKRPLPGSPPEQGPH